MSLIQQATSSKGISRSQSLGANRDSFCKLVRSSFAVALVLATALPANAGLICEGQVIRSILFSLRDADKPMIEATVAGKKGVLMLDNGTPDFLFLNRATLSLPKGKFTGRGFAASGQPIEVQVHQTPPIQIAGQSLVMRDQVRSGDFGFTAPAFGDDFLGFIGTKMVENNAFLLDYARSNLVIFRVNKEGTLPIAPPQASDVVAAVHFLIWPDEQPTIAASLGTLPIVTDFDTGDSGTLYATPVLRKRLSEQNLLEPDGERWWLHGLAIGGVIFSPIKVRIVEAGGPQDFRKAGQADQLRLGASFLSTNPCLWNFPAKTLTFLKPEAAFLYDLSVFGNKRKKG